MTQVVTRERPAPSRGQAEVKAGRKGKGPVLAAMGLVILLAGLGVYALSRQEVPDQSTQTGQVAWTRFGPEVEAIRAKLWEAVHGAAPAPITEAEAIKALNSSRAEVVFTGPLKEVERIRALNSRTLLPSPSLVPAYEAEAILAMNRGSAEFEVTEVEAIRALLWEAQQR